MSWDVVLFNTKQKIDLVEDIDETQLNPTDFHSAFRTHFEQIIENENYGEIRGNDFCIDYFIHDEKVSNIMLSLYGENGLNELIKLAKEYEWQIFDTGSGQMIDLDNPSVNGYQDFQNYLQHVLKSKDS